MTKFRLRWLATALRLAVPTTLIVAATISTYLTLDYSREQMGLIQSEQGLADLGTRVAERLIDQMGTDVLVVSRSVSLASYLDTESPADLRNVAQEFKNLCQFRGLYDQVRFLDEAGVERARINHADGTCQVVPDDLLQDKGGRYYFDDTYQLASGQLFVSPIDLNIEGGQIESPYKPMIRIGSPVFDREGMKRGIVLVNYLAQDMLDEIEDVLISETSHPFLTNGDGYFLLAPPGNEAWQFMHGAEPDFATENPAAWSEMLNSDSGKLSTVSKDRVVWDTVRPLARSLRKAAGSSDGAPNIEESVASAEYFWKIGTLVPSALAAKSRAQHIRDGLILFVILEVFVLVAAVMIAKSRTGEKHIFAALKRSEERARAVITDLAEGLIVLDDAGRVHMMNPKAEQLLGWTESELVGLSLHEKVHRDPNIDRAQIREDTCQILSCLDTTAAVEVEEAFTHKDGRRFPVSFVASPFFSEGQAQGIIVAFQDITERKQTEERLTLLATRDHLTKLLNRGSIEQILASEFEKAAGSLLPMSVMLLDIDHFKHINDSHGHPVGDRVLRKLAAMLDELISEIGHVGRYGGEEFLIVLPATDTEKADATAERIRERIEALHVAIRDSDEALRFTASIGVATWQETDSSPDRLVSRADRALYRAKELGRNQVVNAESVVSD